ncbi:MAG: Rne/Rng family ribonuclease [Bacteroidetes bacterium]|nr:Rne/Rng family ribonuclease [Bacteroidota bacterium]
MIQDLVISYSPSEINSALLENKRLVEFKKEKTNLKFSVGDIYLGKVKKIMPGLNAAFVDVGYGKDAFLHYLDLGPQFLSLKKYLDTAISRKGKVPSLNRFRREQDIDKNGKIGDVLKVGQPIMVQITKEPISTKGPRLSSEISLAGRNIVLMPFSDKVSVSQKLESPGEKSRLKTLLQSITPRNYGVIIRTAAMGKKVALLDSELRDLVVKWEKAFSQLNEVSFPKLMIVELNRTATLLRDNLNVGFSSINVNDYSLYREVKEYIKTIAPEKEKIVNLYMGKTHIFDQFGITKQIKTLFGKTVNFKNGAYLIIEHTEALHVIDVNSGNRSKSGNNQETNAMEVNMAAADEISRQLRLRDMGGIIVVDFIDMLSAGNRNKLFEKMKEDMKDDRAKHNILPLTRFGLMQITRQRVRPEMIITTTEQCPACHGTGEITPALLFAEKLKNEIDNIVKDHKLSKLTLKVHPIIAAYITKGIWSLRLRWRVKYKCRIKIREMQAYNFLQYHFFDKFGDEIIK